MSLRIAATRPLVMGILNVTTDSFSDGGRYFRMDDAVQHAEEMVRSGADIIDVGGESSRPGAKAISVDEELSRVIPVLTRLKSQFAAPLSPGLSPRLSPRLSIDTVKPEVAEAAIQAGATLVNDISGGSHIGMAEVVQRFGVEIILMHMRGTPVTMQIQPLYARGVVEEVKQYLQARVRAFVEMGVSKEKIWIDPGIGFGKTVQHNVELLNQLSQLKSVSERIVVGTSQKSFLANLLGDSQMPFEDRSAGTLASNLWAVQQGAGVLRVHDVKATRSALTVWEALSHARKP